MIEKATVQDLESRGVSLRRAQRSTGAGVCEAIDSAGNVIASGEDDEARSCEDIVLAKLKLIFATHDANTELARITRKAK